MRSTFVGCVYSLASDEAWLPDIDTLHQELLSHLTDPVEHQVASLLLDGKDIPQIVELTGKSFATIYRKVGRIKECWLSFKPN